MEEVTNLYDIPKDFEKYYKKWRQKEIRAIEFAKLIGISRATLYRYINEYGNGSAIGNKLDTNKR